MQRREFLRGAFSLGAAGLLPIVEIANGSFVFENDLMSKSERLRLLEYEVSQCSKCREISLSRTQTVFGGGNPDAEILFLSGVPSMYDEKEGKPFIGQRGNASLRRQLFEIIVAKFLKLHREEVYVCNVMFCRPPNGRPRNRKRSPSVVTTSTEPWKSSS